MTIIFAGEDRSAQLLPHLRETAGTLRQLPPRPVALDALSLATAKDEEDFLAKYFVQMRSKHQIATADCLLPRRRGLLGWCASLWQRFFWRLCRYQHDAMARQQNNVNTLLAHAVDFSHESLKREMAELRAELEKLKQNIKI